MCALVHACVFLVTLYSGLAGPPYRDEDCWGKTPLKEHKPAILFDLLIDPSEAYPIKPHSAEYNMAMEELQKVGL